MNSKFSKKKTEFAIKEPYPESNMHPSDDYKDLKLKTTNIKNLPSKQTGEINSSKPHLLIFPDKIMSDEPDNLLDKKNESNKKTKKNKNTTKRIKPNRSNKAITQSQCEEKSVILSSDFSTPIKATVRSYNTFTNLLVTSITTEGLLTLDEPIGYMEDYADVTSFNAKDREFQFFAVYDGHGGRDPKTGIKKGGKEVASWCVDHLSTVIKDTLEKEIYNHHISNALIESFEKADKELLKISPENVGATAIVILRDVEKKTLYFANLGDSRAVICKDGKKYFETEDSNWTNPKELKRLTIYNNNQSYIIKTKSGEKKKFILNGVHLNGEKWNLATSRSFGDKHFKFDLDKPPVIAIPNVNEIKIDDEMKLILIASDGIWKSNFYNTEHFISKFIQIARKQHLTSENVNECLMNTCKEFVEWCMIDHLRLEIKNYGDNISLIVVGLLNNENNLQQWFKSIQNWKEKYDDNFIYYQEDDCGSDSSSCKFDFTDLNK